MYMSDFLLFRSFELLTAITRDLPMNPGRTRNKRLKSRNSNRRSLRVAAPKSLVQFDCENAASIHSGAQGTFNLPQHQKTESVWNHNKQFLFCLSTEHGNDSLFYRRFIIQRGHEHTRTGN